MNGVAIVGSAIVPNAIYAQPEDDLIMRCVVQAAKDGGVKREEIRAVIGMTPRPTTAQHYQAQHIASRLNLPVDVVCEFELASVGMPHALLHAETLIREHDIPAVAIWASSRESTVPTTEFFGSRTARTSDASFVGPFGMTPMSWNALGAREMMECGEATEEDFANVSVRLRQQAVDNPYAFFRKPVTAAQVLESRLVSSPLRLLMVCPRTDGAACIIVAREDIAQRNPSRAIKHHPFGIAHDGVNVISEHAGVSMWQFPSVTKAVNSAFEKSGLEHKDIDVVEPWIPFSPMEIMVMRAAGFPRDYGQSMCVSPSGGPIGRGYPLLATGFYNWHELFQHLRGEAGPRQKAGARHAMHIMETGNYNGCVVDIFSRFDGKAAAK